MKKTLLAVALAPLCLQSSLVSAQNTTEKTMVVTANRFEQSHKSTLADIEIVTRQDIDQMQAKTLPDVLRRLTGVQITQNGGRGQLASIFVRGTDSDQVLVLVDGVRFSRAAKGAVDFNQIPLTYVQRIEYVRGARASLYGSEAIGGVINIITIARADEESTNANVGLGSLDYQEISVASGVKVSDKGQVNLALGSVSDEGYNVHPVTGLNDGDRHGFDSKNGLLGYVHHFDKQWSAFGNFRIYENVYQYDSSYSSRKYSESEKDDLSATVGAKFQSEEMMSELQLVTQKQKSWDYEQSQGKMSGTQDKLEQQNILWTNSYLFNDSVVLAGGFDWRKESYADKVAKKTFDRTNSAVFGLASARINNMSLEASSRLDENEKFGSEFTYNLAAGYQFIPELGLKASFGTAFKAPSLYQQYDPKYGTKDLKPEESEAWEIGFSGVVREVYWSLTGYDYRINNLIDSHPVTYEYQNVNGESHIQGIELVAEFETSIIQHQLSADYKDAEDADGHQLQRRAKEMYKWNALVSFEQVDWSVSYLYVGKRPELDYSTFPTSNVTLASYSLFDTAVSYYANESTTLSARVANLFDEDYETALGYPAAERAYYLTIGYQF
ncbi:TonB-dependent vitamin B12 receptor [Photobacterium galatheae]|uniref:Vitamin B12 transporter BtuB n=1 Tax=Photobacterium galatheae TaxID=1654360 RepID=A0A066RSY6_9GAMM|nr:TonB-dependent vitamin B12 receptor [Photobacterium galatheae]KDM92176.1 ligand-gated channel [Photobacterium galatheae]MCM0151023.1 TonB-dependent vitamin B12 receptor [Photobacterium galatheae]